MRKQIKKYLPDHEAIRSNRWLSIFGETLLHPRLWHLNRHSAAGAVAVGLFCGLIPGPLQMLSAAVCCVVLRVNLPLALFTTLYTNPLTIVPLYVVAFGLGSYVYRLFGFTDDKAFVPPPDWGDTGVWPWIGALIDWMAGLGAPLAIGLILLASSLALLGYILVHAAWRLYLVRAWRARGGRRVAR
jgi:uncharacterized protein (DUF2062 family)